MVTGIIVAAVLAGVAAVVTRQAQAKLAPARKRR